MVRRLYQLRMRLHKLAEDLWSVEQPLRFPGGFTLELRTVAVRLPSGELVVLSPAPELARVRAELDALGPVRALVAPNLLHHLGLPAAQAAWPQARVFHRPGLEAKRPDVRFTDVLTE